MGKHRYIIAIVFEKRENTQIKMSLRQYDVTAVSHDEAVGKAMLNKKSKFADYNDSAHNGRGDYE